MRTFILSPSKPSRLERRLVIVSGAVSKANSPMYKCFWSYKILNFVCSLGAVFSSGNTSIKSEPQSTMLQIESSSKPSILGAFSELISTVKYWFGTVVCAVIQIGKNKENRIKHLNLSLFIEFRAGSCVKYGVNVQSQ